MGKGKGGGDEPLPALVLMSNIDTTQNYANLYQGGREHWAVCYTSPQSFICCLDNFGDFTEF